MLFRSLIARVAQALERSPEASVSTACHPLRDPAAMFNPNVVKVVLDQRGHALYFSRAPIPWPRDAYAHNQPLPKSVNVLRHVGIYAYRASFLRAYGQLAPAPIEQVESLEQLRALYHGYKIGVTKTDQAPPSGVDTEQDLGIARRLFTEIT